eukprot:1826900-Rhodomonas_salina.2
MKIMQQRGAHVRVFLLVHCETNHKKTQSPYTWYQEFLRLTSGCTCLRRCYAMSGTEVCGMLLRARGSDAMWGTELGYATSIKHVRCEYCPVQTKRGKRTPLCYQLCAGLNGTSAVLTNALCWYQAQHPSTSARRAPYRNFKEGRGSLSSYAFAMRCPVLRKVMLLSLLRDVRY